MTHIRDRFHAWWEGHELPGDGAPPSLEMPLAAPKDRGARPEEGQNSRRISLIQDLWGQGFSSPGDSEYIVGLVKVLGLDPAMSVAEIGSGLGGAARTMCDKFGVWVTGLEADPDVAEAGMELSTRFGMAKKAPILYFDPEDFPFKPKSADRIFSKEFLYTVEKKKELLHAVEDVLKSRGEILIVDYVVAERGSRSDDLEKWMEAEPTQPHPWAVEDYQETLAELHLDVRVTEDITKPFHRLVTAGWVDYIESASRGGIDDALARALVDEVELWTRRLKVLDEGDLKLCRIHAIKKNTGLLMSNW